MLLKSSECIRLYLLYLNLAQSERTNNETVVIKLGETR